MLEVERLSEWVDGCRTANPCDGGRVTRGLVCGGQHCPRRCRGVGNGTARWNRRSKAENSRRRRAMGAMGGRGNGTTYFWPASTGLAVCLRDGSAPLAAVVIFNCGRAPEGFAEVEVSGPLTLEPWTEGAVVLDMRVQPLPELRRRVRAAQKEKAAEEGAGQQAGERRGTWLAVQMGEADGAAEWERDAASRARAAQSSARRKGTRW